MIQHSHWLPRSKRCWNSGKADNPVSRVLRSHYLVLARIPSDSDPKDPTIFGPNRPSIGTDTSLALLEPPVVSGQDPSDSAAGRALWRLKEDGLGLEWLRDPRPHGRGQSDSSQWILKARDPLSIQGQSQVR